MKKVLLLSLTTVALLMAKPNMDNIDRDIIIIKRDALYKQLEVLEANNLKNTKAFKEVFAEYKYWSLALLKIEKGGK